MATSAGNVESKVTITASTNGVEKATMQVLKQQLAFEKLNTQAARTAQIQARTNAIEQQNIAKKAKLEAQTRKVAQQTEKYAATVAKARTQQSLFNKVIDAGKLLSGVYALKTIGNSFIDLIRGSADYIENMNLFNVVMGQSTEKAENFINKMHDALGLDTSKLMEYMGTFKGMANNMGIVEDKAYDMSEGLTKLAYDLSSFYNTSVEQAFTSLSSAITGQTKSIREQFNGIDVTMGTLQTELDRLGIDKTTSDLSYAEKSVLRYISILRQSQSAQGDFARTMMSPSQMMKQMTERVATLARAFGNMFIPLLRAVLPYVLAVTGALTTLFNTISKFLGFEPMTFDYEGISTGMGGVSDDIDSVGDSADKSNKKVKEFKKQLQGFDVLNVITTPTDSSSGGKGGSGGGGFGGIDPRLLAAIDNYNNRLDLASDKVKKIQAAIENFFAQIDFEPLKKSLDNLWNSMKLVGNFAWQGLKDFYNEFLVPVSKWTLGEGLPRFINAIANGLAKIDWDNLNAKLKELFKALAPFAIHVGEGLLWFFEKVLVPLATWTISDVLPIFLDALTSALKILNNAIEVASPLLNWLWDNFLSKIASFVGGTVVGFLQGIADALKLIANNKAASTVLTGVLVAITGLAAIRTVKSLLDTSNGLAAIINKGSQSSKVLTILSGALKGTKVELAEGANKSQIFSAFLKNIGSSAKTVGSSILTAGANFLTFGKNVATGQVSAKNLGNTLSGSLKNSFSGVTKSLKDFNTKLGESITNYSKNASAATKLGTSLVGAAGLYVAFKSTSAGVEEFNKKGEMTASTLGKIAGGALGAAASGAAIGAQFGIWGAAIGGVIGLLTNLVGVSLNAKSAEEQYAEAVEKSAKKSKEYTDTLEEQYKKIENSAKKALGEQTYNQNLLNELKNIVDANGDVQQGYEKRAAFIVGTLNKAYGTEMTMINNHIDGYKKYTDEIQDLIEKKKAEIALNAAEEKYNVAQENKIKLAKEVTKWQDKYDAQLSKLNSKQQRVVTILTEEAKARGWSKEKLDEYIDSIKKGQMPQDLYMNTTQKTYNSLLELNGEIKNTQGVLDTTSDALDNAKNAWETNNTAIMGYEDLLAATVSGDTDAINQAVAQMGSTHVENGKIVQDSLTDQLNAATLTYNGIVDEAKKKGKELNDTEKATALASYNNIIANLTAQTEEVRNGKYSKDLKAAWRTLSSDNFDAYKIALDKLEPEQRLAIEKITGVFTEKTPEVTKSANKLGTKVVKAMDKKKEAKKTANDGIVEYMKGLSDEQQRDLLEKAGIKNVDKVMSGLKKGDLSDSVGQQLVKGLSKGIKNDYWQGQSFMAATGLMNKIIKKMKDAAQIKSPSRKTRELGIYLLQGISKGFEAEKTATLSNAAKNMNNVIDTMSAVANSSDTSVGIDFSETVSESLDTLMNRLNAFYSNYAIVMDKLSLKTQTALLEASNVSADVNDALKIIPSSNNYTDLFGGQNIDMSSMNLTPNKGGYFDSNQISTSLANSVDQAMSKYYGRPQSLNATIPVYIGQDKIDEKQRQISLRNNNMYGTAR